MQERLVGSGGRGERNKWVLHHSLPPLPCLQLSSGREGENKRGVVISHSLQELEIS